MVSLNSPTQWKRTAGRETQGKEKSISGENVGHFEGVQFSVVFGKTSEKRRGKRSEEKGTLESKKADFLAGSHFPHKKDGKGERKWKAGDANRRPRVSEGPERKHRE